MRMFTHIQLLPTSAKKTNRTIKHIFCSVPPQKKSLISAKTDNNKLIVFVIFELKLTTKILWHYFKIRY